jgi:hypothetical protein
MTFPVPSHQELKAYWLRDMPEDGEFTPEDNDQWADKISLFTAGMLEGANEALAAGASSEEIVGYSDLMREALKYFVGSQAVEESKKG